MKRQMKHTPNGPIEKHGLGDPFCGRGELQDYTNKPLGMLKGKGEVIDCPTCGKRGIERKWKRGGGHVVHSDQMVSMLGLFCCEIISSCGVKKEVWPGVGA